MKQGTVKRGFKAFRKTVDKDDRKLRAIRNCNNCKYEYSDEGEKEEYCHNNSVTKFDMVDDGTKKFCTYWKPNWIND